MPFAPAQQQEQPQQEEPQQQGHPELATSHLQHKLHKEHELDHHWTSSLTIIPVEKEERNRRGAVQTISTPTIFPLGHHQQPVDTLKVALQSANRAHPLSTQTHQRKAEGIERCQTTTLFQMFRTPQEKEERERRVFPRDIVQAFQALTVSAVEALPPVTQVPQNRTKTSTNRFSMFHPNTTHNQRNDESRHHQRGSRRVHTQVLAAPQAQSHPWHRRKVARKVQLFLVSHSLMKAVQHHRRNQHRHSGSLRVANTLYYRRNPSRSRSWTTRKMRRRRIRCR